MALGTAMAAASLAMQARSSFGGSSGSTLELPSQYKKAMKELLKRGKADVEFPTQEIEPLSELERLGIDIGKKFATSPISPDINLATQTYTGLAGRPDILKRPEVRGMISKATEEGNLMLNRLGRGMVKRGAFGSTPGRDILGRGVTSIQERIAFALSEYLNQAENRRLAAAGGLERTGLAKETTQLKKIGTAVDLGSLTRSIQQQIKDAQYRKLISDIEMEYVTQPNILASVMSGSVGQVTGGEPSMFAQASPLIGQLLTAGIMQGQSTGTGTPPGGWDSLRMKAGIQN